MPLSADTLDRDMRAMFADLPQTVAIRRGRRVVADNAPCAATETGGEGVPAQGAQGMDYADGPDVTVAAADCAVAPRPGDSAEISGWPRKYRVASVRRVPGDPAWTLSLEAV